MKRIGIVTFQRAHNYGAILQCYALQEKIIELGYSVDVIDYRPRSMDFYKFFLWNRLLPWHPRYALKSLLSISRRKKRYDAFNDFINNNLHLSNPELLKKSSSYYDLVIIGSDQVWNPKNSLDTYDYYYWGKFKQNGKPRIISYAVSMGGSWKTADWEIINKLLNNFDSISVREEYLQNCIKEKCNRESCWVLDPTLLVTRNFWLSKIQDVEPKNHYLFYYQARNNDDALKYSQEVASKMNLDFVCISADIMGNNSKECISINPIAFLRLIKNATYVLTTSFHGTVFCYQLKKRFSTIKLGDGEDGRSIDFLSSIGLENHIITLADEPMVSEANWSKADEIIERQRQLSLNFLFNNIK